MSSGYEERGRWKKKEGSYFPLALLLVFICKPTRRYGGAGPHHTVRGDYGVRFVKNCGGTPALRLTHR